MIYIKELLGINCKDVARLGLLTNIIYLIFTIQSFGFKSWFLLHQLLKFILIVMVPIFSITCFIEIISWKYPYID